MRRRRPYIPRQVECLESRRLLSAQSDINAIMIADYQEHVLPFLEAGSADDLLVLEDLEDIGRMGLKGYLPGHEFTTVQGMGFALGHYTLMEVASQPQTFGQPSLFLYEPNFFADIESYNTLNIDPDFPYRLIGWVYVSDYNPHEVPDLGNYPADAWQVHEAGFHTLHDGGFNATPPDEHHHGSGDQQDEPGIIDTDLRPWHRRFWNISFFLDPAVVSGEIDVSESPPRTAIHDPWGRIPVGHPSGPDAFFFPEIPFEGEHHHIGTIQAEDFDMGHAEVSDPDLNFGWFDVTPGNFAGVGVEGEYRLTDVDIAVTADASGGFDVVRMSGGEFLQYTIDVDESGEYEFAFRMANDQPDAQFRILVDGIDFHNPITIPHTNDPNAFFSFFAGTEELSRGHHEIRVQFESGPDRFHFGPRFNSFTVSQPAPPVFEFEFDLEPLPVLDRDILIDLIIKWLDISAIEQPSIDDSDIRVTNRETGFDQTARLVSTSTGLNSNEITATYRLTAPGDAWDPGDNGEYLVEVLERAVRDTRGNYVAPGVIGKIKVDIPRSRLVPHERGNTLKVQGTDRDERIEFRLDNDEIVVLMDGEVVDSVRAELVTDILVYANGGDDFVSGEGLRVPMMIDGGSGADVLIGGEMADEIHGQSGDDQLSGRGGADRIFGEEDNDVADFDAKNKDFVDLGTGKDGIAIRGTDRSDVILISRRVGDLGAELIVNMNGETSTLNYLSGETVFVFAGQGNDTVMNVGETTWSMEFHGEDGNDLLVGGNKDDLLDGGKGHDVMIGGEGADQLFAQDGRLDFLLLDSSDTVVTGDAFDRRKDVKRRNWFRFWG